MAEKAGFQARQFAFAAHIRDPDHVALPDGIDDRRMAVYRKLFFNNLKNLLATMFPVLRALHDDTAWQRLVREFMRVHRATTPYFLELPREFLLFLDTGYVRADTDYPFLTELAHYEYAELEVAISTAETLPGVDPDGDLLEDIPVRAAACRVYTYRWPVHRISATFTPTTSAEEPVCLAIYRRSDDKVRFAELNVLTVRLLELIGENPDGDSGAVLLGRLAAETGYPDAAAFTRHGHDILREMRETELISGTLSRTET